MPVVLRLIPGRLGGRSRVLGSHWGHHMQGKCPHTALSLWPHNLCLISTEEWPRPSAPAGSPGMHAGGGGLLLVALSLEGAGLGTVGEAATISALGTPQLCTCMPQAHSILGASECLAFPTGEDSGSIPMTLCAGSPSGTAGWVPGRGPERGSWYDAAVS